MEFFSWAHFCSELPQHLSLAIYLCRRLNAYLTTSLWVVKELSLSRGCLSVARSTRKKKKLKINASQAVMISKFKHGTAGKDPP